MTTVFLLPDLFGCKHGLHIIKTEGAYIAYLSSSKKEKEPPYAKSQSIYALIVKLNAGLPSAEWLRLQRDGEAFVLSYAGQSYRQTEKPRTEVSKGRGN